MKAIQDLQVHQALQGMMVSLDLREKMEKLEKLA